MKVSGKMLIPHPRKTARVDNATVLARIEEVQHVASQQSCLQKEILDVLEGHREATEQQTQELEEVNQQLAVQGLESRSLFAAVKDALNGILEVKTMLVQVSQNVISLQLLASNISRPLDPTKELPVIFEDALGRQIPIPPEWIESLDWKVRPCPLVMSRRTHG